MPTAMITGLGGTRLSQAEADFLRAVQPCGLILFARNCETPAQVLQLVTDAKAATGLADLLVLIDQEGGRVRRLKSPAWRDLPPAAAYAALYRKDAAEALRAGWLSARLTADELGAAGINTNCAPVLDVPVSGSHDIIGDRAYGTTVAEVVRLGRAVAEGYVAGGVLPVIKHIPGHGRARADSHFDLPVVDASRQELSATDFAAFRAFSDYPAAMTAHVVFDSIDPRAPASVSEIVTREIIRGEIGFDGLLMSDDLSMRALRGSMRERAQAVLAAGSDIVLHCNGNLDEMADVAAVAPELTGEPLRRLERCLVVVAANSSPFNIAEAEAAIRRAFAATA